MIFDKKEDIEKKILDNAKDIKIPDEHKWRQEELANAFKDFLDSRYKNSRNVLYSNIVWSAKSTTATNIFFSFKS